MSTKKDCGSDRFQIEYRDSRGTWMPIITPAGWFRQASPTQVREYFSHGELGLSSKQEADLLVARIELANPHRKLRIVKIGETYD